MGAELPNNPPELITVPFPVAAVRLKHVTLVWGPFVCAPSSRSLTESVLLDAGIPVGLFPIHGATDETGNLLVLRVSFTEQVLYQTQRYSSNFYARFPFRKGCSNTDFS